MSYTLISEERRTARKPHRCIWCWQRIAKGERYEYEAGINDGDFQSQHFHPECQAAKDQAAAEEGGYIEWTPGMDRPPTAAALEYDSWDCALLLQGRLL